METRRFYLRAMAAAGIGAGAIAPVAEAAEAKSLSFVDDAGVWRWRKDDSEVVLYGVNYCLPSAAAFRLAKKAGSDLKACVRRDLRHLKRMGQDAIRLCFWGDWENTTDDGHLIVNEHLELLDYLVSEANKLGFYMLLSPIVTYDAWWPDAMDKKKAGFSNAFKKEHLGQDRKAIEAQVTYLVELLQRQNPLTGATYGTEPRIIAVEPINEPWHHPDKPDITRVYLRLLARAVKAGGFDGPVFYNVSQDMRMAPFIGQEPLLSGATFAWYPTGLLTGFPVRGNQLLLVDDYPQMRIPELATKAKMVYEFDAACTLRTYVYPAMVRAFRRGGAQWATMFAYDAVDIAPANSEFNDHYLNLIYTPGKAIGALIGATAFRRLERAGPTEQYGTQTSFAGVELDARADLAVYRDAGRFYHSNTTRAPPADLSSLTQIAGVGSSPVAEYEGLGAYFLDKRADGAWRLEVYPDVVTGENPFPVALEARDRASVFVGRRRLRLKLPDLGSAYELVGGSGDLLGVAQDGVVTVEPGVYLVRRNGVSAPGDLDAGGFYAPAASRQKPLVRVGRPRLVQAGQAISISLLFTGDGPVGLKWGATTIPLQATDKVFHYTAVVPPVAVLAGSQTLQVVAGGALVWEGQVAVASDSEALTLVDVARDRDNLIVPYGGYRAYPGVQLAQARGRTVLRIDGKGVAAAGEYVGQFLFDEPLSVEAVDLSKASKLEIVLAAPVTRATSFQVSLIAYSGPGFAATVQAVPGEQKVLVSLADFKPGDVAWLPRDFPIGINPALRSTDPGARLDLTDVNAVQIRVGPAFSAPGDDPEPQLSIQAFLLH